MSILASTSELVRTHLNLPPHTQRSFSSEAFEALKARLSSLFQAHSIKLVAHYYVDSEVQALAEALGGLIGDSLEMARFGKEADCETLLVAGVRFMGETAKILSPEKRVLILDPRSECSLELLCPSEAYRAWREAHPDRVALVYANTSAAVKAMSDYVVTSSSALSLIQALHQQGKKLLFASDQNLGRYLQHETSADMLIWEGACVVHEEFQTLGLDRLKALYPDSALLAHPESPEALLSRADFIGSTTQIISAAQRLSNPTFIVATEKGIFYKMQKAVPGKLLIEAPTQGPSGTCQSCARCPWMALNHADTLNSLCERIAQNQSDPQREIQLPPELIERARLPIQRLLDFTRLGRL